MLKALRWERGNEERKGPAEREDEQRKAWGLEAVARTSLRSQEATKGPEGAVTHLQNEPPEGSTAGVYIEHEL